MLRLHTEGDTAPGLPTLAPLSLDIVRDPDRDFVVGILAIGSELTYYI